MKEPYSFPSLDVLKYEAKITPEHMRPSLIPYCGVWEGIIPSSVIDDILVVGNALKPYSFGGCEAETREFDQPLSSTFSFVNARAKELNKLWWNFELDDVPSAWLQTYSTGDEYRLHMDACHGQDRKLTVVLLLTDEDEYEGGELCITPYPLVHIPPKTKGTLIAFPSYIYHSVSKVVFGFRQTINLGYYGPPFK